MRRLNLVFLAVLLVVVAAFGGGMHLMHGFQMQRNASALLERARRAEAGNDLEKAEQSLREYLNLKREDGPAWEWFARVVDHQSSERRRADRSFLVHEEALRYNSGNVKLERRCADLALELGRYSDAQRHLTALFEQLPKDSQGQPAAVERAELEDLLGQCERGSTRYEQAEKWFAQALEHDPARVVCYDRLARLLRNDLRRNEAADRTIKAMVAKNLKSGLAYASRWRYSKEFFPSASQGDIQEALKLAPDDLEVLFTAAVSSEQKPDAAAARVYYEKGFKLDPKNLAFALGLANLELREQHLERAEMVLRQAFQAKPSLTIAFELADTLIRAGKVDAKDGAGAYIVRLRNAGLGDTMVRFLEAEIPFQKKDWLRAIPTIESARAVLRSNPRLSARLNLMLAECYGRMGSQEQRLDALRQAAESDAGPGQARIELTRALAQSGKLDQALAILSPLVDRQPDLRLDIVRLMMQKTLRLPPDQRRWGEVEQQLQSAEKALPSAANALIAIRADLLVAQNRVEEARKVLTAAQLKYPRILNYRLALARIAQKEAKIPLALQTLEQAEKDLGPGLEIQLARLELWAQRGGDEARAAVAKLAEWRKQMRPADLPDFLVRLAQTELRLNEPALARQHLNELVAVQPDNNNALLSLFDLSLQGNDLAGAREVVAKLRKFEGDREGTYWRFTEASLDLDEYRRDPKGAGQKLNAASELASTISELRPGWWGGPVLKGQIAELKGLTEEAIEQFKQAVMLGDLQPGIVHRLMGMLYRNPSGQANQIEQLVSDLRSRGFPVEDLMISDALAAVAKGDVTRGLGLARQVISESSSNFSDHLLMARLYTVAAQHAGAEKELRRAIELAPGVPETWLSYLEHVVAVTRQADQAKAVIETASKALPPNQSALTLARCWMIVGDARKAEAFIQQARTENPDDPATLQNLVLLYLAQSRVTEALKTLDALEKLANLSQDGKTWASRLRPGLLMRTRRLADQDEALRMIEENLKRSAGSVVDLRMKISTLAARPGRRGQAIKLLEDLIATAPTVADRFYLAKLYLMENMVDKYQREMLTMVGPGKANLADALAHYSRFLLDRSKLDDAERYINLLKTADPLGLTTLELEAQLLSTRKQRAPLLALLEERGRKVPDQIGQVGDLLARYGFAREAEQAYKAYVARDPDGHERVLALAGFYATTGRTSEAMKILSQAWTALRHELVAQAALAVYDSPTAAESEKQQVRDWVESLVKAQPDSWLKGRLSSMRLQDGKTQEAISGLREILAGNPDDVRILNNLAWSLAFLDEPLTKEALKLIDHAIEVAGSDPSLSDTRAVILIRAGLYDEAIRDLKVAQEMPTQRPTLPRSIAAHLAWAYQGKGQIDEARQAFRQAEARGFRLEASSREERPFMTRLRQDLGLGAEVAPPAESHAHAAG